MKKKLTDRFLQNLRAPDQGRLEIFDTYMPGFGVRIGRQGRATFFVMYRVHGKQRRHTIGHYPALLLADARTLASQYLASAASGIDPVLEAQRQRVGSFESVATEFLDRYAVVRQKPRTYKDTARYVNNILIPAWGQRPLDDLTRRDAHLVLDRYVDAGKSTTANRLFATMSRLFGWCVERGYLEVSPILAMKAPAKEVSRDRVLSLDEVRAIWQACDQLAYPFGYWVQMLFATCGQRTSDVAQMRRTEIHQAWWEISKPTKSDTTHRVPLSNLALELLDKSPQFEGNYVFSSQGGTVPISGFSKAKKQIDRLSEVSDWRYHDIRRTVATLFGEQLGRHPYVIERLQNRKSGTIKGVVAVYNRATYDDEMRSAAEDWSHFLRGALSNNTVIELSHGS